MADHRKSFRPRRLAFDGRLLSRGCLLGATLALLCALSPVQAQDAGLKNGAASLNSGNYNAALRELSAAVNDRKSSKGQAAKALYLRGVAYRKLNQPGRAVSDLGAAIWLGLSSSDKVKALVNKGLAYRAAGLSSQSDAEFTRARSASSSNTVQRLISEDGGVGTATADSVEISSSGQSQQGESFWTSWIPSFGGSATPRPKPGAPTPPPAAAAEPSSTRTAAAAPASGWDAQVSDGPPKKSSSGVGRWFESITGDSSASAPIPAAPSSTTTTAAPRTTAAPKATVAPPTAASWAANTDTQKVASKSSGGGIGRWFGGSSSSKSSAPAPAAAPAGGGYRVQLANSRSQADAKALWKQVQGKNSQLASVQPQIEKVDIGSFGTFYSLKVGPYASQSQSTKVCNALKRSGTDCSIVSPDGP